MNLRIHGFLACLLLGACHKDQPPRTRAQFCSDWAVAACSDEVVSVCQAADVAACRSAQEEFCRGLVPSNFSDENGDKCIAAVKDAYKDGDLKAAELATVLRLGPPCDLLIVGPKGEGDDCTAQRDCDASAQLECVYKSTSATGVCEVPVEVGGGRSCKASEKTCELGFYCDGANCLEAKSAGDACTIQGECGETGFCADDGKCKDRLAVGDSCAADRECKTGICYAFENDKVCTDRVRLARAEPICADLR